MSIYDIFRNTSSYWAGQGRQLGQALGTRQPAPDWSGSATGGFENVYRPGTATSDDMSALFRDPGIGRGTELAKGSIEDREGRNTASIEASLALIGEGRTQIEGMEAGRLSSLAGFDVTPFSDEEREARQQVLFDIINEDVRNQRRMAQLNATSRGFGRGSSEYGTGAGFVERGAVGKSQGAAALLTEQSTRNQAALEFRENMLSQVSNTYAPLYTRLTSLEGLLQAGDQVDPSIISDLIQDAMTADVGIYQEQQYLDFAKEMAEKYDEDGGWEAFVAALTAIAPGAQQLQSIVGLGAYT